MMAPTTGFTDDSICNNSLMIKTKSIADATDGDILDILLLLQPIKILDWSKQSTKGSKNERIKRFAFVEFFSVQDAENVYRYVTQNEVRLNGDQLIIQYSRNNRASRYEDHSKPFGTLTTIDSITTQFIITAIITIGYYSITTIISNLNTNSNVNANTSSYFNPLNFINSTSLTQPTNKNLIYSQLPKQMSEISIVQPIIQAPYQAAQLAQERIILKQEQKLPLSTLSMNLMSTLPPKIDNPKPQQQQQPIQQQSQQQKKQQKAEETEEDVKSDKEDDQPSPLPAQPINKVQPQLTEAQRRKKAELELKKWEKQQQTKIPGLKVPPSKSIINQVEQQLD
ncbi:unnamed protein product [Paramecium octaurelia]|uniref:RRM domain-containing protein n=1 Tax=Paramecium octaurelia TaxID=43137 RepID=A0A8S1V4W6_PAROT|nr:unnamed protein product [Paramecium octaurelia]